MSSMYSLSVSDKKSQAKCVKNDRDLFRRIIVSMDAGRDIDIDNFLKQELSEVPLSLASIAGSLRGTNKAQLAASIADGVTQNVKPHGIEKQKSCTIIDGMSLVQSIKRQRETRSFGDYADLFIGVVKSYLADSARVDVVFDRYLPNSIKHGTRIKRARGSKGIRRIIDGRNVKIPDNWTTYISVPENKASLAKFLSEEMINIVTEGEIITSGGFEQQDHAMSNQNSDVSGLFATHEEADTRIILHGGHALSKGFHRLIVVCKDTDVLLMLYATLEFFAESNLDESRDQY